MGDSEEPGQHSGLRHALQRLTNGTGIQREDLLAALSGELRELQRCWGVNLSNGSYVARKTIEANLMAHAQRLVPLKVQGEYSAEQLRRRYIHAVLVSFNVSTGTDDGALTKMDLSTRRNWLAHQAPENLRISPSTSQRYLTHALDQIEQQILAGGFEPVQADAEQPTTLLEGGHRRSSLYVAREDLKTKFIAALQELIEPTKLIAIVGLPGMGKTWFARAVTTAVSNSPLVVVRVLANNLYVEDLQAAFQLCGIDPAKAISADPTAYLALLLSDERAPDVLLLDNLESANELGQFLPAQYRSTVVATCRRADQPPPGCTVIEVGKMTPDQSSEMVLRRLPDLTAEDAATLASTLYDYPLVIAHACRLLTAQHVSVPDFCQELRRRLSIFSGASTTEETQQTLIVVIKSLVEALRVKNTLAAQLLLFLVHGGYFSFGGRTLPQGLVIEALNWRNGRAISLNEYLEAVTILNEYFYLEFGPDRAYHKARLDNIQLHPLVGQLLFWNIYGYRERVVAAACLVRAAMTYAGRPEVQSTWDEEFYYHDLEAINIGVLYTVAALLLDPESRTFFKQLNLNRRHEIELFFCYQLNFYWPHIGRVAGHLNAALSHIDSHIRALTGESLKVQYNAMHERYILKSLTKDK